ncbi:50S ribosomal protein L18 [Patescibacteria group bacterium]|nr:50S ribosomal protein L18 [Patescibacteria group bacterium]
MNNSRSQNRIHRHKRVRSHVNGTAACPRVVVWRSLKHISAQAIDDVKGHTIVSVLDKELDLKKELKPLAIAAQVGQLLGEKLVKLGIKEAVFDRAGFAYHGRVKALAESLRQAGLKF